MKEMAVIKSVVVRLVGVNFTDEARKIDLMKENKLRETEYANEFEV